MKLLQEVPTEPEYVRKLAWTQYYLGEQLADAGRMAEAEKAHLAARDRRQRLVELVPVEPLNYRNQLADSYRNLGWLYQKWQRGKEAEEAYRKAIDLLLALVKQYPREQSYRDHLALNYHNLGFSV